VSAGAASLGDGFLTALRALVPGDGVLTDRADLAGYERGWRYGQGKARAAVRPTTPEQVAAVLALCHQHGVRVQPLGANTGLVGASNPDATGEQLVLSCERLKSTIAVDAVDRTVLVDAGVTLSALNTALAGHGLFFPIDLGADPQIGGMIATNTGGTCLLKYGDVRKNLLGLQVALADGTLLTQLSPLRKNNTGLDLKQLFVGTSGTFGVVTRAVLQVCPRPKQKATALLAANDGDAVLAVLQRLEADAGDSLTAFEAISRHALALTLRHGADVRSPFAGDLPAYMVLAQLTSTLSESQLDLPALLQQTLAQHLETLPGEGIADVVLDPKGDGWHIRHQVSESLRAAGRVLAFDLAVPRSSLARFTQTIVAKLAASHPFVTVCDFGHWGDGGTHLNLVWDKTAAPAEDQALVQALQAMIYGICVHEFGGSYSAEHGVGPHNQHFYDAYTPAAIKRACAALKAHFDGKGMLGTVRLGS
jgi:FAD/FMN-containing dehydrogenase